MIPLPYHTDAIRYDPIAKWSWSITILQSRFHYHTTPLLYDPIHRPTFFSISPTQFHKPRSSHFDFANILISWAITWVLFKIDNNKILKYHFFHFLGVIQRHNKLHDIQSDPFFYFVLRLISCSSVNTLWTLNKRRALFSLVFKS